MARPENIEAVANKFQQWASTLPNNEKECLADWMGQAQGAEIQGYSPMWWQSENAFCDAFMECCPP